MATGKTVVEKARSAARAEAYWVVIDAVRATSALHLLADYPAYGDDRPGLFPAKTPMGDVRKSSCGRRGIPAQVA